MLLDIQPLVSIITPCYNQGRYLAETLDSLIAQTYERWECIIVNDGSTDNSQEVALRYVKKDSRFKYFYKENSGVSDTRNFAVRKSKGTYLLPLDSDDIIGSQYIEKAIKEFEKNEKVKVVFSEGEFFGDLKGVIELKPFSLKTLLLENTFFCPVFFKKKDFEKVGGYSLKMDKGWEDWELMIRLLEKNDVIVKLPETFYKYRIISTSRERQITTEIKQKLFLQMYYNNQEKYDYYFPDPILFAFFYNAIKNKNTILEKNIKNILESRKYKIGQILAKIYSFIKKK